MRNRQMIVHWLMANTKAIEAPAARRQDLLRDGRSDRRSARASARLLAEVQRIKSEGDYAAAGEFLEKCGIYFDPVLRDEIVARTDVLNLAAYTAFVQPRLDAVVGAAGEIVRRSHLVSARPHHPDARLLRPQRLRPPPRMPPQAADPSSPRFAQGSRQRSAARRAQVTALPAVALIAGAIVCAVFESPLQAQTQTRAAQRPAPAADGATLRAAIASGRRIGARRMIAGLRRFAKELKGEPALQVLAVRAMGRLERASLVPEIAPLLESPSPVVRMEAANALGQAVLRGEPGLASAPLIARARVETDLPVLGVLARTLGRLPYQQESECGAAERDADRDRDEGVGQRRDHRPRHRRASRMASTPGPPRGEARITFRRRPRRLRMLTRYGLNDAASAGAPAASAPSATAPAPVGARRERTRRHFVAVAGQRHIVARRRSGAVRRLAVSALVTARSRICRCCAR